MKKNICKKLSLLLILLASTSFGQVYNNGYYDSISVDKTTFINDLKARIRSPYVKWGYDDYSSTIIPNYESRDTTNGKRVITCIYSGENYVYTPPFSWGYFSREHTWCYSWMPTYGSENGQEYSDQHHLFPANQNSANGIRSNHPLGNVAKATYQYLGCKLGADSSGNTVFEPRPAHKGDAARALLYMAVKYDDVNGLSWNFNYLNSKLPSLNEGPEKLETLLQWNSEDPPDLWEIKRNNYIESIQKNRNPFVDHPEYVNYIDFNTLTLKTPANIATEPANQFSNLTYSATDTTLTFKWIKAAAGSQAPAGYFLMAYKDSNFVIPVDGYTYASNNDLSTGRAFVYVPYNGADSIVFTNLNPGTGYLFTAYAYNGSGSQINYKTTGVIPQVLAKTAGNAFPYVYFDKQTETVNEISGTYNLNVDISSVKDLIGDGKVLVKLISGNSAAVNGFTSQQLTFTSGGNYTQTIPLKIVNDTVATGTQSLGFSLQYVSGNITLNNQNEFTLNIIDDDAASGGNETFANFPETGSAYVNGTFKGQDGSTWSYIYCSGNSAAQISSHNPVLKKDASAKIESGVIQGGCGAIIVKYMQAFSANVALNIYVNDSLVGKLTSNSEVSVPKISDSIKVNIPGPFKLRFQQSSATAGQVTLGNIMWSGYSLNSVIKVSDMPSSFTLEQNYPNPFNPETTIRYSIPKSGNVSLKVYNTLGQLVSTLVDGYQQQGSYKVKFNAVNLASGVYLYKLTTGNFSVSKKLLLMK